jgi:glycerol-3-phosphate acyltransferase PlsY
VITFTPHQTVFLFISYLVAAIPFGVLVSLKIAGKDVREQGSGNTGAANVSRLMGKKWGVVVLLLDALKGFVAVKLSRHYGGLRFENLIAFWVVFAHCYPIYLGFKGGKGVATALGAIGAISPLTIPILGGVFAVVLISTRRISAASLAAAASVPLIAFLYHSNLMIMSATSIAALIWWKHRENVRRLWRNEEPQFF